MSLLVVFWVSDARRDKASGACRHERLTDLLVAVRPEGLVAAKPCFVLFFGLLELLEVSESSGYPGLGTGTCEVTIRVIRGVIPVFIDRY